MIKLANLGSKGRMGEAVAQVVRQNFASQVAITVEVDLLTLQSFEDCWTSSVDAAVCFMDAQGLKQWLATLKKAHLDGKPLPVCVVGSTGYDAACAEDLLYLASVTPMIVSANFSIGIALLHKMIARVQNELLEYDVLITETHHQHKKDSPSGTALYLQSAFKTPDHAPIHSMRRGSVIGVHTVHAYGIYEELHLEHRCLDRTLFAKTAVWVATQAVALIGTWKKERPGLMDLSKFLDLMPSS